MFGSCFETLVVILLSDVVPFRCCSCCFTFTCAYTPVSLIGSYHFLSLQHTHFATSLLRCQWSFFKIKYRLLCTQVAFLFLYVIKYCFAQTERFKFIQSHFRSMTYKRKNNWEMLNTFCLHSLILFAKLGLLLTHNYYFLNHSWWRMVIQLQYHS